MAKMPQQMEEMLLKLDNPEQVKQVQQMWNELVIENEKYELNYPQQFGNIVEANRRFGEHKTIPTPAEQLRQFEGQVMAEMENMLDEKEREELYELDEQQKGEVQPQPDRGGDFKLTFGDMALIASNEITPDKDTKGWDIDQSQELGVTWMKEYREQMEAEQLAENNKSATKEEPAQHYDFKLVFSGMEELEQDGKSVEPEMEQEREDMDMEYE